MALENTSPGVAGAVAPIAERRTTDPLTGVTTWHSETCTHSDCIVDARTGESISRGQWSLEDHVLPEECHSFQREMHESNVEVLTTVRTTLDRTNEVLGRAANTIDRGERICTQIETLRSAKA